MITRRRFVQAGIATTALLAWPFRAFPFSLSVAGIKKFAVDLPGLGPNGIPLLSKNSGTINGHAADVYNIVAKEFTQDVLGLAAPTSIAGHQTRFWGYGDGSISGAPARYLGGVVVAKKGTPVQFNVTNDLPVTHILPVDASLIDPASGNQPPLDVRQDRIAVHLHGGLVFWNSDGGPFHWFSSDRPPSFPFVKGQSFQNAGSTPGTAIYQYPNDQSARLIWYHDHAYGLTRTNAFAGVVSAYLITDDDEATLITTGVLPGTSATDLGIPLIIQDKTFWAKGRGDDDYPAAVPTSGTSREVVEGDLWYPHQYEGFLDPPGTDGPSMDFANPSPAGTTARWGASPFPLVGLTGPSSVPEYFSDTILVNGAPYPVLKVTPQRFRFRFLNGSQGRFYNLQLYVANDGPDGITLEPKGTFVDPNGNPVKAPSNAPGPAFIQIGNECGFLPKPVVFGTSDGLNTNSNRFLTYKDTSTLPLRRADAGITRTVQGDRIRLNAQFDPTLGNPVSYNLLMAPAERPDVIIDFTGFSGRLILWNDAPAPFPGGDIRNDLYVGAPDMSNIGGPTAPTADVGPDTRIIMAFDVSGESTVPNELTFAQTVDALNTVLPVVFSPDGGTANGSTFTGRGKVDTLLLPPVTPDTTLGKSLLEDNDEFGRLRQLLGDQTGNSFTYIDLPIDVATEGEVQEWQIFNLTADTHPMHFHLVNVNVVERAQWAFNAADGTPDLSTGQLQIIPGTEHPPDPNEMGWKETVRMNPGEVTTVRMKFLFPDTSPAQPNGVPRPANSDRLRDTYGINGAEYVWHCHILEHEEHDMMHPVVVLPSGVVARRRR